MAFIPTADTLRCALNFTSGTQVGVNTLWLKKSSSIVSGDYGSVAVALTNWWDTYGKDLVPAQTTLVSVDVVDQNTSTSPSVTNPVSPAIVGTAGSTAAPLNVSLVCSFRTLGRGRSARGRWYMYGISEADTNNDGVTVASTLKSGVAVLFANLAGFISPLGFAHVVVSKQLDGVVRSAGFAQAVITYIVDDLIDSQRRRLAGRGI